MKTENMIKELVKQGYMVTKTNKPKMNMPSRAFDFFYEYRSAEQEHILLCTLDNALAVIDTHVLHVGTLNSSIIDPKAVFRKALLDNAAQFMLCHNHPSGELDPSPEDINMTQKIIEAGKLLTLGMVDHIIISYTGYTSIRERCSHLWD